MLYLVTFLWCIPSPIFLFINAEAWVIGHALLGHLQATWLGVAAGLGQVIGFSVLFFAGERIIRAWPKLDGRLQRFDSKRYERWSYSALCLGSVSGFPPTILLTLAARPLGYRYAPFLLICIIGRCARFITLAHLPHTFISLFH